MKSIYLAVSTILVMLLTPATGVAGDRELEVLLVNMTPDPVSQAGRQCSTQMRRQLRTGYVHLATRGESALRRQVGRSDAFMQWQASDLRTVAEAERGHYFDLVLLFDCRPEAEHFDALMMGASRGLGRMRLRRQALDRTRVKWLADAAARHGWVGFSP